MSTSAGCTIFVAARQIRIHRSVGCDFCVCTARHVAQCSESRMRAVRLRLTCNVLSATTLQRAHHRRLLVDALRAVHIPLPSARRAPGSCEPRAFQPCLERRQGRRTRANSRASDERDVSFAPQDFKWHRAQHSPNWSLLPVESALKTLPALLEPSADTLGIALTARDAADEDEL